MKINRFRLALMLLALAFLPATALGITVPDNIMLNTGGQLYNQFKFDHARHITTTKECSECHHHTTGTMVEDPNCIRCHRNSSPSATVTCRGCHPVEPFSAKTLRDKDNAPKTYHLDKPGLKGAMHQSCIGCHKKIKKGPVGCTDCHGRNSKGDEMYRTGEHTPKVKPGTGGH